MERSSPLSDREAEAGRGDELASNQYLLKKKIIGCYSLTLDFYKDILLRVSTGKLKAGKLWSRADTEMEEHQAVPFVTGKQITFLDSRALAVCCAGMCSFLAQGIQCEGMT